MFSSDVLSTEDNITETELWFMFFFFLYPRASPAIYHCLLLIGDLQAAIVMWFFDLLQIADIYNK